MTRKLGRLVVLPGAPAVAFEAFDALMFVRDKHLSAWWSLSIQEKTKRVVLRAVVRKKARNECGEERVI
jgi:hypothetical protein